MGIFGGIPDSMINGFIRKKPATSKNIYIGVFPTKNLKLMDSTHWLVIHLS